MDAAIWGLLGTVVGALASIGTAWLAAHTASQRETEKLRVEQLERSNAFQRQTLIDLQDAIHDSMRLVHRGFLEDKHSQSQGGAWGKALLPETLDENLRIASRRVAILVERVSNDTLREQLKQLMQVSTQVLLAVSEQEASSKLEKLGTNATQVLEVVGATLRAHYK